MYEVTYEGTTYVVESRDQWIDLLDAMICTPEAIEVTVDAVAEVIEGGDA